MTHHDDGGGFAAGVTGTAVSEVALIQHLSVWQGGGYIHFVGFADLSPQMLTPSGNVPCEGLKLLSWTSADVVWRPAVASPLGGMGGTGRKAAIRNMTIIRILRRTVRSVDREAEGVGA